MQTKVLSHVCYRIKKKKELLGTPVLENSRLVPWFCMAVEKEEKFLLFSIAVLAEHPFWLSYRTMTNIDSHIWRVFIVFISIYLHLLYYIYYTPHLNYHRDAGVTTRKCFHRCTVSPLIFHYFFCLTWSVGIICVVPVVLGLLLPHFWSWQSR